MQADEQHAIRLGREQVALEPVLVVLGLWRQQHELLVGGGQHFTDAHHEARKERVAEELGGRLRDDQRDRVGATGGEASGDPVGRVAETIDSAQDGLSRLWADPVQAVHDARHGRTRYACRGSDLLERGPLPAVHVPGVPSCRHRALSL